MRSLVISCFLVVPHLFLAQETPVFESEGYWLSVETYAVHTEGDLAGMSTYRLYLNTVNANDYLSSCSGDENRPLILSSSSGEWYNHPASTTWNAQGVNPVFFVILPDLAFDSFLTIGAEDNSTPEEQHPSTVWGANDASAEFVGGPGNNITVDDATGGAWYKPFPGTVDPNTHVAFAGEDLRVLLAQFTTSGTISGQIQIHIFQEGSQQNDLFLYLSYGTCTSEGDVDADGICDEVDSCVGQFDVCGVCNGPGEIYQCGCSDIPAGDCDCEGNQLDVVGVCGGDCAIDNDENGICDTEEIYGCTYALADNFQESATRDDGSCIFPCEGNVNANVFDWDGDYNVTVADFLMMLSVYGDTDVDLDGIWDSSDVCVDLQACNYSAEPSEPCAYIDVLGICGGGCDADEDADGICDDVDSCIGVIDECGVCNGPGPTEVVIENITILYDSVYAEQIDQWFVFEVGADTTFAITCGSAFLSCGDPVFYQGYAYATVLIGEQCWFAENLRSENYENGDAIPSNLSNSQWSSTTSGAVTVYGEGSEENCTGSCNEAWSLNEYGRLYNWYAVDDARGLCPSDWHVSTDEEWTVMTNIFGGIIVAGDQLKTTYGWNNGGNGTNSSGFSALPGGVRDSAPGNFAWSGFDGAWWSPSPSGTDTWGRYLGNGNGNVYRNDFPSRRGFSVRCVRDAE